MVPENRMFFCRTTPTASRRRASEYSRTSLPLTRRVPDDTSYSRGISCTSEDFAEPVPPMMPTVLPSSI